MQEFLTRLCAAFTLFGSAAEVAAASVDRNVLQLEGASVENDSVSRSAGSVSGPHPNLPGFISAGSESVIRARLNRPVENRGTVMFWFRTDRLYRSGSAQPTMKQKLVELPGAVSISFTTDPSAVSLAVEWAGQREIVADRDIRVLLPEIPGPAWHHFAVVWDAHAGVINAFLDGSPYYVPGERVPAWPAGRATGMEVHLQQFAMAHVKVSDAIAD